MPELLGSRTKLYGGGPIMSRYIDNRLERIADRQREGIIPESENRRRFRSGTVPIELEDEEDMRAYELQMLRDAVSQLSRERRQLHPIQISDTINPLRLPNLNEVENIDLDNFITLRRAERRRREAENQRR